MQGTRLQLNQVMIFRLQQSHNAIRQNCKNQLRSKLQTNNFIHKKQLSTIEHLCFCSFSACLRATSAAVNPNVSYCIDVPRRPSISYDIKNQSKLLGNRNEYEQMITTSSTRIYVILNFTYNLQNEHFDEFTELESA